MTMKWELSFLPDVGDKHTGKLAVKVTDTYKDRLKEIPGYAWSNLGRISTIPRAWPAVLSLGALAKKMGVSLAPDEEVLAWYQKNHREWKAMREAAALLGVGNKADGLSYYPHQLAGAEWLLADSEVSGRALLDETGIGKTGTLIAAIQQGQLHQKGPILVICPESVMTTGWTQGMAKFAPELRTVEITGLPAKRKKILQSVADGEYDVAIIGYSLLRQYSRFEAFPGHALRRCIKCGGPRLTTGQVDDKGKPLPDLVYHEHVGIRENNGKYYATCQQIDCDWHSDTFPVRLNAEWEAAEHTLKFKKISEVPVSSCQTHMKELNDIGWSVIIADEAHRALNPRSQTTQALWGVAKYAPSEPHRWAATGTIISRRVDQAWPVLHFLDPAAWPSKSKWVDWYCDSGYNWAGFWEVRGLRPDREEEFQATFGAITRRVLKEQVLDLPPKLRWGSLEERLRMSGEQLRVYEDMRKQMLAMVDEGAITAQNVLVQASRLSMLASGTGYPKPDGSLGLRLPSAKVAHLIAMWKDGEFEGEQIALLFSSRRALRMTEQALYEENLITPSSVAVVAGDVDQKRRSLDINDFQAGRRNTVLLTYAAGGTGITLTAASQIVVFERNWSPILNAQGEDRFHRIGSERHNAIVYRDFVVENSNEVAQLDRMDENAQTLESIVHDRDRLRQVFGG